MTYKPKISWWKEIASIAGFKSSKNMSQGLWLIQIPLRLPKLKPLIHTTYTLRVLNKSSLWKKISIRYFLIGSKPKKER